jgi:cell division protein FtsW
LPLTGEQTWFMHHHAPELSLGERSSTGDGDGQGDQEVPDPDAMAARSLGGVRDQIGVWRALLDRPLTSYYLVLGITALLLGLGLVMVQSTASVADLNAGLSPYTDFKKQLLGAAIGVPLMWVAARSSPRLFRAFAYPLLALAVVGLGLTLIHGVGVSQNGAARWISLGGQQIQPSEIAKLALIVWGADLLARKERLGQLTDWRHILVPLMPGTALLCLLVMTGDDLGTTFILLIIFLALLWVIGTPGRVFAGILVLMALAMVLMMVSSKYRMDRLFGYLGQQGSATGANMQSIQSKYAIGSGGIFGVGLGASREKWGWVPESTSDFIFAIIGEELGLIGTLCVTFLYGGLAFAGLRIARRVPDMFSRLAATGITAWIVMQAVVNIGVVIGLLPITGVPLPLVSAGLSSLLVTLVALGMLMSFARREPGAREALAARAPGRSPRVLSWLGLAKRRRLSGGSSGTRHEGTARRRRVRRSHRTSSRAGRRAAAHRRRCRSGLPGHRTRPGDPADPAARVPARAHSRGADAQVGDAQAAHHAWAAGGRGQRRRRDPGPDQGRGARRIRRVRRDARLPGGQEAEGPDRCSRGEPQARAGQQARRQVHHPRLHRSSGHTAQAREVHRHTDQARDRGP